jgi:hypothetical protein
MISSEGLTGGGNLADGAGNAQECPFGSNSSDIVKGGVKGSHWGGANGDQFS